MKRMLLTGLLALWTGLAAAAPLPEWVNSVPPAEMHLEVLRSEERRVGKECISRLSPYH